MMNVLRTLRNNWKKTVFFGGLVGYGLDYGYDHYRCVGTHCFVWFSNVPFPFRINQLMRKVCSESLKYGQELLPDGATNRRVVVILNPTANKRSAEKAFEKYCGPVLFLAGITVDIVKTESEGFGRSYVETELKELPDAILVAGGDGTLSEVVTGLLRRGGQSCKIGVLPVGRTNTATNRIFPMLPGRVEEVQALTSAALAVVHGQTSKMDVLKIEILPEQGEEENGSKKPIYAMSSIQWGAFRDALALRDKYWYYGGFREQMAIFFNAIRSSRLNWDCRGTLTTTPACAGCVNCFETPDAQPQYKSRNWWSFFVPTKSTKSATPEAYLVNGQDVRKRVNTGCGVSTKIQLEDINELLLTINAGCMEEPKVLVHLGSAKVDTLAWIKDACGRTKDVLASPANSSTIECRTVELIPERKTKLDGSEEFYSIDNEAYEVQPIRVTLLPRHVNMFTM